MVTLLYRTLEITQEYDTVIWCTWVIGCGGNNFAFKPLQITIDRLTPV